MALNDAVKSKMVLRTPGTTPIDDMGLKIGKLAKMLMIDKVVPLGAVPRVCK